jgi:hypothetical protein
MRSVLESRYSPDRVAVIIAADDPALEFLLDHAPDLLGIVLARASFRALHLPVLPGVWAVFERSG